MRHEPRYLMIEETPYNHVSVVDDGEHRLLRFGVSEQTSMSLANPLESGFEYTDYFHLPVLFGIPLERALFIGLGGGMGAKIYRHIYPDVQVDAVEIDPVVVDAARRFFYLEEDDHLKIHIADGRRFLESATARYEVAILDAYVEQNGKSGPPNHLMERDFFQMVHDHLSDRGMLVFNLTASAWGEPVKQTMALLKTIFPSAYQFNVKSSLNVALVGTMDLPLTRKRLRERAVELRDAKGPTKLSFMDMANMLVEPAAY